MMPYKYELFSNNDPREKQPDPRNAALTNICRAVAAAIC